MRFMFGKWQACMLDAMTDDDCSHTAVDNRMCRLSVRMIWILVLYDIRQFDYLQIQRMHVGSCMQDLAIVDDGWDTTTHHISSCQLIVNIASWCTRLRTLAFKGKVLRSRDNDGDAFPSAVSRLTALQSLALHNLKLLVRTSLVQACAAFFANSMACAFLHVVSGGTHVSDTAVGSCGWQPLLVRITKPPVGRHPGLAWIYAAG
jgi:hypothetical protein